MAYRFIDGFAHYNTLADLQTMWAAESSSAPSTATLGTGFTFETGADNRKSFGQSLGIASGSGLLFHTDALFMQTVRINKALSRDAATTRTLFQGARTNQGWRLTWDADGSFELFNQADTSQGKSSTFANNTHTFNFITLIVPTSSSATVRLFLNGSLQKSWTGVDTRPSASLTSIIDIYVGATLAGASTGCKFYISDVVLESFTSGSSPTTAVANYEIETIYPTGTGDKSEWVNSGGSSISNYSYVDEHPPDTSDYLACGFAKVDLYTFLASRGTTNIQPEICASVRYDPAHALSDQSIEARYKFSGSEVAWGSFSTYRNLTASYELRPTMLETGYTGDATAATQWGLLGNKVGSALRPSQVASYALLWATLGVVAGFTGPVIGSMGMGLVGGRATNG